MCLPFRSMSLLESVFSALLFVFMDLRFDDWACSCRIFFFACQTNLRLARFCGMSHGSIHKVTLFSSIIPTPDFILTNIKDFGSEAADT